MRQVTHLLFRHLDSRRAPIQTPEGITDKKFDGPSLYGITVQAPSMGKEIQTLVSGADAVALYASLNTGGSGKPTPYRAGIGMELIAYHAGIRNPHATHVTDIAPVTRGPLDEAEMKEIQGRYGPDERVAMEDAIIAYMSDPAQLQDDATERPDAVGARYARHVGNTSKAMLEQLADGQTGLVMSAAHEPCLSALAMYVTGKAYDEQVFGGAMRTAESMTFKMTQEATGRPVQVQFSYRRLERTAKLSELLAS
jgi:hypothetical protein